MKDSVLTDDQIRAVFEKHCECRPIDIDRTSHSHDCDKIYTDACREALRSPYGSRKWLIARERLCKILQEQP